MEVRTDCPLVDPTMTRGCSQRLARSRAVLRLGEDGRDDGRRHDALDAWERALPRSISAGVGVRSADRTAKRTPDLLATRFAPIHDVRHRARPVLGRRRRRCASAPAGERHHSLLAWNRRDGWRSDWSSVEPRRRFASTGCRAVAERRAHRRRAGARADRRPVSRSSSTTVRRVPRLRSQTGGSCSMPTGLTSRRAACN